MEAKINSTTLSLVRGDITEEATDAIVNAANSRLAGGGGVDGAIHRAGGPAIMEECRKIGVCPAGSAVFTTGGNLKARYVIHAVGPIYKDGLHDEPSLLESAYAASLRVALDKGLESVAFPSISTGAYGYPIEEASRVALSTVICFIRGNQGLHLVRFVLFSDADYAVYSRTLASLLK
ncbi:MAG TPA: O-acetyl-ADP-ribose deacetylase [Thermodesulfobacteriota bacterium]